MKTGIIVLNYNDSHTTANLVNLISNYSTLNRIIIVDNCSTDNSYERLLGLKSDKVDIIKSGKNGGYAYGNNYGIKYALNNYDLDIIFIANPDVEFKEQLILRINEEFQRTDFALLSGIMTDHTGMRDNTQAWKIPTYIDDLICSSALLTKFWKRYILIDYSKIVNEVEVLSGSLFAIRSSVIKDVDYFDEGTFLYCEERILAKKLREKNYRSAIVTDTEYIHMHGSSTKKRFKIIQMRKMLLESRYYYQVKYNKINKIQKVLLRTFSNIFLIGYRTYLSIREIKNKVNN